MYHSYPNTATIANNTTGRQIFIISLFLAPTFVTNFRHEANENMNIHCQISMNTERFHQYTHQVSLLTPLKCQR